MVLSRLVFVSCLLIGAFAGGRVDANVTFIKICNESRQPILLTIYEHGGGLLSSAMSRGWLTMRHRDCYRESIGAFERRAFAFGGLDPETRLVPLTLDFDLRGRGFRGSVVSVCVPVQEIPSGFSRRNAVTPPCSSGDVAVPVSANIRGGNRGESFTFEIGPQGPLRMQDTAYTRAWADTFGSGGNAPSRETAVAPPIRLPTPSEPQRTDPPEPKETPVSPFARAFEIDDADPDMTKLRVFGMRNDLQAVCETSPAGALCRDYREWRTLHSVRNAYAAQRMDWMTGCTLPDSPNRGSMTIEQSRDSAYLAACEADLAEIETIADRIDHDRLYDLERSILAATE